MFEEPVHRPPWEAASILLPVTQSCTWNRCKFCYRSKEHAFRLAPYDAFEVSLQTQKVFYAPDAPVFLIGSNNFVLAAERLKKYLSIVKDNLPGHGRIAMFSRVDATAAKTDAELRELAVMGPLHLYVGTESGSDAILQLMDKGHTAAAAAEQLHCLDRVGITYTVFYILGLGGRGSRQKAAVATARLFNEVHPVQIVTTGMTVTEGTGVWEMQHQGAYVQASEREKIEELRLFLRELTVDSCYDGLHALNPVHYRFDTGDAAMKQRVLADLDRILEEYTDEELEAAVGRAAMAEASKPVR